MSSNIMDIYTSLAKMEVGSVKARNVDKVKLTIRSGDLPMRFLLPSTQLEGDDVFVMIGNLQNVGWSIRDLCLFAEVGTGRGVEQYSEAMVDYMALYLEKIKYNRNPATNCTVKGVEMQLGVVPWADKSYWAIDITVTVEEIL